MKPWPDRRPRACDVKQCGLDAQISTGLLKLPGEAAQPDVVRFGAGEPRYGIWPNEHSQSGLRVRTAEDEHRIRRRRAE